MVILVKLLGIFIVCFGVVYLLKPSIIKLYMAFWAERKKIYIGAALSLIISGLLLFAAPQCRVAWFVTAFGILGLIKGIALLAVKHEKIIAMLNWWQGRSVVFLRVHALAALIIGALLIFAA